MDKTTELELIEKIAGQLSLNRVKTEGAFFNRDYKRNLKTNMMELKSEKAVIHTQGKTTKVAFGEGQKYKTYDEAVEGVKEYWKQYFKNRRLMDKSETTQASHRRRQKQYRATHRSTDQEFERRQ